MDTTSITNLFATQAAENISAGTVRSAGTNDSTFANIYDNLTANKSASEKKSNYLDRSGNNHEPTKQDSKSIYEQNKYAAEKHTNTNNSQNDKKQNITDRADNHRREPEETQRKETNKTESGEIKKTDTQNNNEKPEETETESQKENINNKEDNKKTDASTDKTETADTTTENNTGDSTGTDKSNNQNSQNIQMQQETSTEQVTKTQPVTGTDDVIWNTLPENSDTKAVPVQNYTSTSDTEITTNNGVNSSNQQSSTASTSTTGATTDTTAQTNQDTAAKVANEQILSNIEFEKNVEDMTDEELKKLLNNNAQASTNTTNSTNTKTPATAMQGQTSAQTVPQNLADEITPDVEIKTEDTNIDVETTSSGTQKPADTAVKSGADRTTSNNGQSLDPNSQNKITINLQSQNPGIDAQLQESTETAPDDTSSTTSTADIDTSTDEALIKANTNNTEEQTTAINVDDIPNKVKDKAISTLQSAAPTATVEASKSSTDTGTDSNSSFSKSNANEEVIKMSVKNAAEPAANTVDAFGTKIERNAFGKVLNNAEMNTQLNKSDIMNQINSRFSELQNGANSKVTIVLRPENLGRIHLEIVNSQDGITAKMATENQQVKELLDKNMDALRASLHNQGVNVNNLKVETTSQSSNPNLGFEHEQFNQNASQHSHQGSRQTANREASSQYNTEEQDYEMSQQSAIETQTSSGITHNGKVDYTV